MTRAMQNLSGRLAAVVALATLAGACGASDSQVKAAKEARYTGDKLVLFNAAKTAVSAKYEIEKADPDALGFETRAVWFQHDDGMRVPMPGDDMRMVPDKALNLAFAIALLPDGDKWIIKVTPKMMRRVAGSPKPEAISENDFSVEGWAHGKIDALATDIHNALAQYEVKTVPAQPGAAPGATPPPAAPPPSAPPSAPPAASAAQ